jgi:hypothetical protein
MQSSYSHSHFPLCMYYQANILMTGLHQRDAKLRGQADELYATLAASLLDLTCFSALNNRELRAAGDRVESLKTLVTDSKAREAELQERFRTVMREREDGIAELHTARSSAAAVALALA